MIKRAFRGTFREEERERGICFICHIPMKNFFWMHELCTFAHSRWSMRKIDKDVFSQELSLKQLMQYLGILRVHKRHSLSPSRANAITIKDFHANPIDRYYLAFSERSENRALSSSLYWICREVIDSSAIRKLHGTGKLRCRKSRWRQIIVD